MEQSNRKYWILNKKIHGLGDFFRRITFPGFSHVPAYDVFSFFLKGLIKGSLNTRASSVAFNFLLALGPGIIFLLSFIPYLPVRDSRQVILEVISDVLPTNSYIAIENLLGELFQKRSGLTLFGFLLSIFFTQKGMNGLIEAFNSTYHNIETRLWYKQRLISLILVAILFTLALLAVILLFFSKSAIIKLVEMGVLEVDFTYYFLLTGRWIILVILTFISISFLYYLAPVRKTDWKFFSAGSLFATIFTLLTSVVFSYFVNNFAQFNKFFGSIGALIALMLWVNFNALSLLAGFELNASINNARMNTDFEKADDMGCL